MDSVPLRNVARVLNEKKFIAVLRKALEEAVAAIRLVDDSSDTATGSPVSQKVNSSPSKKRKRNNDIWGDEMVGHSAVEGDMVTAEWKLAVCEAVDRVTHLSRQGPYSEYMKSAIRTSSDEAARILGAWLALCGTQKRSSAYEQGSSLLTPFLDIWDSRTLDSEDARVFSKHCLYPSLIIMYAAGQRLDQRTQLEKLIAGNIIVPAKTVYGSSQDVTLLVSLVGDTVSRNPCFAPIIFDIIIRCTQHDGSRPRAVDDTVWLQVVICAIKEAMNGDLSKQNILALNQMLRYCIDHKIALELPFLRLITSQYGLPTRCTNWHLLATIIELDSNAFLIPSKPEDLLKDLLVRITEASIETAWPTLVDLVVDKVLAPLMSEFAEARQLTAFIRHWYEQLVEVDKLERGTHRNILYFTAWEDKALRDKLKDLLEPSLTTLQIVEIVGWLVEKVKECQGAACVLLDAIAEAVSNEDTRTALYLILTEKVINVLVYSVPDDRFKARLLHLNTVVVDWLSRQSFPNTSIGDGSSPLFLSLLSSEISFPDRHHSLVALEAFRYLCAQWSIGAPRFWDEVADGFRGGLGVETLSNHLTSVASHVRKVLQLIAGGRELGEERWEGRVITIKRGIGWLACAYASCILVDYPQVLEYV